MFGSVFQTLPMWCLGTAIYQAGKDGAELSSKVYVLPWGIWAPAHTGLVYTMQGMLEQSKVLWSMSSLGVSRTHAHWVGKDGVKSGMDVSAGSHSCSEC